MSVTKAHEGPQEVEVGQVWRRKSSARLVTIINISSPGVVGGSRVTFKGPRTIRKLTRAFLREFEFVREGGE